MLAVTLVAAQAVASRALLSSIQLGTYLVPKLALDTVNSVNKIHGKYGQILKTQYRNNVIDLF
jgi:hypothetical protein